MEYTQPPIIAEAGRVLTQTIPKAKSDLKRLIVALDGLRHGLAKQTALHLAQLYQLRAQYLWPKDKDVTELDRKTRLDNHVAPIEADYKFMLKLDELIKDRIELIKLLLKDL